MGKVISSNVNGFVFEETSSMLDLNKKSVNLKKWKKPQWGIDRNTTKKTKIKTLQTPKRYIPTKGSDPDYIKEYRKSYNITHGQRT